MGSKFNRMKIGPKVFLGLVFHQRNNPAIIANLKSWAAVMSRYLTWLLLLPSIILSVLMLVSAVSIMVLMLLRVSMVSSCRYLSPLGPLYV